jgi:TldD protein
MIAPVARLFNDDILISVNRDSVAKNETTTRIDHEELVQHAVAIARQEGAQYADARFTYTISHMYKLGDSGLEDGEHTGIGIRALVDGYWGFTASPSTDVATVERLARRAVAQARVNAKGSVAKAVDMGEIPKVTGQWSTPVAIDPFTVPMEEKHAFLRYWEECAQSAGVNIDQIRTYLQFTRQERVVATSDGSCFSQRLYESGGQMTVILGSDRSGSSPLMIDGIDMSGQGWELFLNADVPQQLSTMRERFALELKLRSSARSAAVGRYTVVCDGATMAELLGATLGTALQLDRALGYEANAGGTSFLDDPLAMLGTFKVASPLVNVTANRSRPTQLATTKWDDEGIVPQDCTLVKDGVLVDFQTTREQAAWLAPYYTKIGRPVRSNGCAAAENALAITMQHMPNLALEPGPATVRMEDLIANVKDGILIEKGSVVQVDFQARNGLLASSRMRKIQNGRLGPALVGGAIQFSTLELWKNVTALGGPSTQMVVPFSKGPYTLLEIGGPLSKGEPPQMTSHSLQAVAATLVNQALIDPSRKM